MISILAHAQGLVYTLVLCVTNVKLCVKAIIAIWKSLGPIEVPFAANSARILP